MIVVKIRFKDKITGPPYTEFYEKIKVKWSPELDEYLILQPARGGIRIIILDTTKTEFIAQRIMEDKTIHVEEYLTLNQYRQKIILKLIQSIDNHIIIKTLSPAIIQYKQIANIISRLKPIKAKTRRTNKGIKLEAVTILDKEKTPYITNLILYGIGKNRSLGYGTIIWRTT